MKKLYFEPKVDLIKFYEDVLVSSNPDDPYGEDKDWGNNLV